MAMASMQARLADSEAELGGVRVRAALRKCNNCTGPEGILRWHLLIE